MTQLPARTLSVRVPWQGSDEVLVQRLREGSEVAAAVVYDRYEKDVDRLVWRLMGADPEHDDIVSEVFLSVFRDIGQLRTVDRLRSWILGIAVNAVRREFRRRSMWRRHFNHQRTPDEFADVSSDPEVRLLLSKTFAVIDQLPPTERLVFVLRYVDQHSLQECAELCRCSLATVKRRLSKAARRFDELASSVPEVHARLQRGSGGGQP